MGGITVAPQIAKSNNDSFLNFNPDTTQLNTNPTMDELLQSAHNWPVEDLTNEVQDLLLRESMSWLPWVDTTTNDATLTNNKNNDPLEGLDPQLLAQSLQLDSLFGQEINFDQLDEVAQSSLLYDELTYEPSTDSSPLSTPSVVQEEVFEEVISENDENTNALLPTHHQKDLSKNDNNNDEDDLSSDSSSDEEDDKDNNIQVTVANEDEDEEEDDDDSTDDDSTDDDSDDEEEIVDVRTTSYMYLPKRQIEEALLEKITHRLHADKLPGILSIVSASNDNEQREEEVEIDLSSLGREQLVRVMLYVDACIEEQRGGPSVKLSNYIVKDPKATSSSIISKKHQEDEEMDTFTEIDDNHHDLKNAGQKRKRKSKPSSTTTTPIDGPISMAGLTKRTRVNGNNKKSLNHPSSMPSNNNNNNNNKSTTTPVSKRRRKTTTSSSSRRKQQKDSSVSMKVKKNGNGLASSRPKRRTALHKRRMLEETLLTPSDDDNDDEISITPVSTPVATADHEVLIVYSDEQMDFGVVENQTIVHQPSTINTYVSQTIHQSILDDDEDDEDDEEIDIM